MFPLDRYVCSACPAMFKSHSDLLNHHKDFHSNVKFKCAYCNMNYKSSKGLYAHLKTMHPNAPMLKDLNRFVILTYSILLFHLYYELTRETRGSYLNSARVFGSNLFFSPFTIMYQPVLQSACNHLTSNPPPPPPPDLNWPNLNLSPSVPSTTPTEAN